MPDNSLPATRTAPDVGSANPPTTDSNVDFPQPLAPRTAINSPAGADRLTSSSAFTSRPAVRKTTSPDAPGVLRFADQPMEVTAMRESVRPAESGHHTEDFRSWLEGRAITKATMFRKLVDGLAGPDAEPRPGERSGTGPEGCQASAC